MIAIYSNSVDGDEPYANLLPVVEALISRGNRAWRDGFVAEKAGWACMLRDPIDMRFVRSQFLFPETIDVSDGTDAIFDHLSWCTIQGPNGRGGQAAEATMWAKGWV